MTESDLVSLTRRIKAIEETLDGLQTFKSEGDRVETGKTTTVGTYPTAAQSYYAFALMVFGGPEVEATTPTSSVTGNIVYAFNLGSAIPPPDTQAVAALKNGRWTFRFDG